MKSFLLLSIVVALVSLSACGGGTAAVVTPQSFTISVAVTGLSGGGTLVLQDNASQQLSFTADGTKAFSNTYSSGAQYSVSMVSQPTGETCTPGGNTSGTMTANVTVTVSCSVSGSGFTISGTVSGLPSGASVTLADNTTDTLPLTSNGPFTFNNQIASGSTYNVTVATQPTGGTCTVTNGSGTATANVTNVQVSCSASTSPLTLSASVTGLSSGTLVLQDDAGKQLTFTSNGTQQFSNTYLSGGTYIVTVATQPAGQLCTVGSNGTGTITTNTTVSVTCSSSTFTIGGTVTGLPSGVSFVLANGTDTLTITTNGAFTFAKSVASGSAYNVVVQTQPSGGTCTVSNGSGTATANVTNVSVTCALITYTLSASVTGLSGGTLVVQDDAGKQLSFTSNTTQQFSNAYANGASYAVTVATQPAGQSCVVGSNGSGNMTGNTTVSVTCSAVTYTLSASVTGLSGGTLVLQDDAGKQLSFTSNTTQPFSNTYASGSSYSVTVATQPVGQSCIVGSNGSGNITANTTVGVACTPITYTLSAAVSGLNGGTLVLQDDAGKQLSFTSNTTQTFSNTYASGSSYSVTVATQPSGQTCTLSSNSSGTIAANTTVTATCTATATLTLSVSVTGLNGGTLVVQDDQSKQLSFTSNKTQTFSNTYASGATYSVSVVTQPSGQTCTLSSNSSGTITANTTVTATCTTSSGGPNLSVKVSGLSSGSVKLQDDLGDILTFTTNSTQEFTKSYTSGATYEVYVTQQPTSLSCTPTYSQGTITSNQTINVVCASGATRSLGTISGVSNISCSGSIKNGVCQQMTVSCPNVPDVLAYVKTNQPSGTPLGTVTYGTGTQGNGLYETLFTFGSTAVQNVLDAGFTTVQISWGTPFNQNQPGGWVQGPAGVLAAACRYATVTNWIYTNIQNNSKIPLCATANSGGSGALAYALSQYPTFNVLSMAEVTSGPPTGRLDWGCGCTAGSMPVQCGSSTTLGTCFGKVDAGVWDPAYGTQTLTTPVCSNSVNGTLPPGGDNFLLGDSVEAPGATYNFPKTHVNLVFGGADSSSAIPIGQDWFNNITSTKSQVCVPNGQHSMANTLAGAQQIANDLIGMCKLQ